VRKLALVAALGVAITACDPDRGVHHIGWFNTMRTSRSVRPYTMPLMPAPGSVPITGSDPDSLPPPEADGTAPARDARLHNFAVNNGGAPFPLASASHSAPPHPPFYAVDGNYWYHRSPPNRWTAEGSGNATDWFEVDFGIERSIEAVKLYFLDDQGRADLVAEGGAPVVGASAPDGLRSPAVIRPPVGYRLEAHYPMVPIAWEMGVGFAITSYNQKLYFGLMADAGAAPDVERLGDFLAQAYVELRSAAGVAPIETTEVGAGEAEQKPARKRAAPAAGQPLAADAG